MFPVSFCMCFWKHCGYYLHAYLDLAPEYEISDTFDVPMSEDLLQYRVTESYTKMDSQQVNLSEGQIVHVIERFDTGEACIYNFVCN